MCEVCRRCFVSPEVLHNESFLTGSWWSLIGGNWIINCPLISPRWCLTVSHCLTLFTNFINIHSNISRCHLSKRERFCKKKLHMVYFGRFHPRFPGCNLPKGFQFVIVSFIFILVYIMVLKFPESGSNKKIEKNILKW